MARAEPPGPVPHALEGQPGFWVPRALFYELEQAYEAAPRLHLEAAALRAERDQLRISLEATAATASAAMDRRAFYKDAYEAERQAHAQTRADAAQAAQRGIFEQPALWVGVGVLGALGIAWAASQLRPDPIVISP